MHRTLGLVPIFMFVWIFVSNEGKLTQVEETPWIPSIEEGQNIEKEITVLVRREAEYVSLNEIIDPDNELDYATRMRVASFVGKHMLTFHEMSEKYEVPLALTIAWAALESRWGHSELVLSTRNVGNIKCKCNRRPHLKKAHKKLEKQRKPVCKAGYDKIEKGTDRYVVFASYRESFEKKFELMSSYKAVRELKNSKRFPTLDEWVTAFHKAPYATDKLYDRKLFGVIKKYNLEDVDIASSYVGFTSLTGKITYWEPLAIQRDPMAETKITLCYAQ